MEKLVNKNQVQALFDRDAVLLGTEDGIPEFRVVALFGADAVAHVKVLGKGGDCIRCYGVRGYVLDYLTLRGFQAAASFSNVQLLRKEDDAEGV